MTKKSGIFYILLIVLLVVGAIGGVAAKELVSIYDAPDLYLTQGSEEYDLLEGIIYDSSKYELAVKDTGDFDIEAIGEYQVSYTLTPKRKDTVRTEEKEVEKRKIESDSEEETILFKRTVFVEAKVVDGYYLYAPALFVEPGNTDYNLLEGVELRKADTDEKVEDVRLKVADESSLQTGAMTAEEIAASDNEESNGEADSGDAADNPALKEGNYEVTIEAENPDTQETMTVTREVQVQAEDGKMTFSSWSGAKERYDNISISMIGGFGTSVKTRTVKDSGETFFSYYNSEDPDDMSMTFVGYHGQYLDLEYYMSILNTVSANLGSSHSYVKCTGYRQRNGGASLQDQEGPKFVGYLVRKNYQKGDWDKVAGNAGLKDGNNSPDLSVTVTADAPNIDMRGMDKLVANITTESSLSIDYTKDGTDEGYLLRDGGDSAVTYNMPANLQVKIKNAQLPHKAGNVRTNINLGKDAFLILDNIYTTGNTFGTTAGQYGGSMVEINGQSQGDVVLISGDHDEHQAPRIRVNNARNISIIGKENVGINSVYEISNFKQTAVVDTTANDVKLQYLISDQSGSVLELKGEHTVNSGFLDATGITVGTVKLSGNTGIAKNVWDWYPLRIYNTIQSNGYRIQAKANSLKNTLYGTEAELANRDVEEGEVFACIQAGGKGQLDATDFKLATDNAKKDSLYLTSKENGTYIYVVKRDGGAIEVSPAVGGKTKFYDYEEALDEIKTNGAGIAYTITNHEAMCFGEELKDQNGNTTPSKAASLLSQIPKKKASSLKFVSGTRTDGSTDGKAGTRYRIRVKDKVLTFPKDVDVTFEDCVLKYAEGDAEEKIEFVRQGGNLTFEKGCVFIAGDAYMNDKGVAEEKTGYFDIYGGADTTDCEEDVTITCKSGTFGSIYGGNRTSGEHTGKVEINISEKATVSDTINGNSRTETGKQASESTINIEAEQSVKNIYNYDKLNLKATVTVTDNLNSELSGENSYSGTTKFDANDVSLQLMGKKGSKIIGSLTKESTTTGNSVILKRVDGDPSDIKNPYIFKLTKEHPIQNIKVDTETAQTTSDKVIIRYDDTTQRSYKENDIVMYLPKATEQEVTTAPWNSQFHAMMREKAQDRTIRLLDSAVKLTVNPDSSIDETLYISLAELLQEMVKYETGTPGQDYKITFLKEGYRLTAEDLTEMKKMSSCTANKIEWTSKFKTKIGYPLETEETEGVEVTRTINLTTDMSFFGKETVLEDIKFQGVEGQNGVGKSFYANGKKLTVEKTVEMTGDNQPVLYGGSETAEVENTDVSVKGGTFFAVYGGGKSGDVTKKAKVTFIDGTISTLYGGSENKNTTGTRNLSVEPLTDDLTIPNIKDFTTLEIGDKSLTDNRTFTISGILDSNKTELTARTGKVILHNAKLKFTGTQQSKIGSLQSKGSNSSIIVYKYVNDLKLPQTVPLYLDQNVSVDENNPILLNCAPKEARGHDLILEFSTAGKADTNLYKSPATNLSVVTNDEKNEISFAYNDRDNFSVTDKAGHTDVKVSSLATYDGTGKYDLQNGNTWYELPSYYTMADLYGMTYSNLEEGSTSAPVMNTIDATKYLNAANGFAIRNEDGSMTYEKKPESSVTVKLLKHMNSFDKPMINQAVYPATTPAFSTNVFQDLTKLSVNRNSSMTIDGNDYQFWANKEEFKMPAMQLEIKNLKVHYLSGSNNMFTISGPDDTTNGRAYLRLDNLKRSNENSSFDLDYIAIQKNIDVDIISGDTSNDDSKYNANPYYIIGSDINRNARIILKNRDLVSAFWVGGDYKKVTVEGNGKNIAFTYGLGNARDDKTKEETTLTQEKTKDDSIYQIELSGEPVLAGYPTGKVPWQDFSVRIFCNKLTLKSDATILKSSGTPTSYGALHYTTIDTQNHLLYAGFYNSSPKEGAVFAQTNIEGAKMDPTDFAVNREKHGNSAVWADDNQEWVLIFNRTYNTKWGWMNTVSFHKGTAIDNGVEVSSVSLNHSYSNYYQAFEAIENDVKNGGGATEYTITNKCSLNMEKRDLEKLASLQSEGTERKTLIFQSAEENYDSYGWTTYGERYHIRLRENTIELPSAYDVKFENLNIRCSIVQDAQEQPIIIVKNGGVFTVGEGVSYIYGLDNTGNINNADVLIYGGSITAQTGNSTRMDSTVNIYSGHYVKVYGAGQVAQQGDATVNIFGGKIDEVYGGGEGNGTLKGNTAVHMTAGTVGTVYGGGKEANVEGAATVQIESEIADHMSIYGGGNAAKVTGNTDVQIQMSNTTQKHSFVFDTISAYGTGKGGQLAQNVEGQDKKLKIKMKNTNVADSIAEIGTLSGFTELVIGNETETDFNSSEFKVLNRLDSNPTGNADKGRTDTVILNHSQLTMSGAWQGHIGSLETKGTTALTVYKTAKNDTKPLLVDGSVKADTNADATTNRIRLKTTMTNEGGDVILKFTKPDNADKTQYMDGTATGLEVSQDVSGQIYFKLQQMHTVESWIEYPENTELDENTKMAEKKIFHFTYTEDNEHEIAGGYVIRMKKTDVTSQDITDAERKKYTETDKAFLKDGTTFSSEFTDKFTENMDYYPITFTPSTETGTVTRNYGVTQPVSTSDKYWYIAHIVCKDQETSTMLIDVNAPVQKSDVKAELDIAGGDDNAGMYKMTLAVADPTENDQSNVTPLEPEMRGNNHLPYEAHGIKDAYWAIGDVDKSKNTQISTLAAKLPETIAAEDTSNILTEATLNPVSDGTATTVSVEIPQAKMTEAKEAGQAILLYVKDSINNTVEIVIPVNEYIINVKVPLKVNVVAVKKDSDTEVCELLAPTCYVVNNGDKMIKAEVNGFNTTIGANNLTLAEDKTSYTASEIALQLVPKNGDNADKKTNVLSINKNPLSIGTMSGTNSTSGEKVLQYTFDAAYNVTDINIPNGWISNTMSYHFTVENTGNN